MNTQQYTKFKDGDQVYFPAYGTKVYKVRSVKSWDELEYPLAVYEFDADGNERLIENFDEYGRLFTNGVPVLHLANPDNKQALEEATGVKFEAVDVYIKFGNYYSIPKPIAKASELKVGDVYYAVDLGCLYPVEYSSGSDNSENSDNSDNSDNGLYKRLVFMNDNNDRYIIQQFLAHRTKENAIQHAKELLRYNRTVVNTGLFNLSDN